MSDEYTLPDPNDPANVTEYDPANTDVYPPNDPPPSGVGTESTEPEERVMSQPNEPLQPRETVEDADSPDEVEHTQPHDDPEPKTDDTGPDADDGDENG